MRVDQLDFPVIEYPDPSTLAGANPSLRDRARDELELAIFAALAFGPYIAGAAAVGWVLKRAARP